MARGEKKSRGDEGGIEVALAGGIEETPLAEALPIEQYLAAIVAHELSNPFTALAGRVELMRNRKDASASMTRDLDSMKSANDRIERILSNLKTFSRRESLPPRPIDLFPLAAAAVERFRNSPRGAGVEISVRPADKVIRASVDPVLLEKVVAAVIETLVGRSRQITSMELRFSVNAADEEVSLHFCDRGPEISEADVARVFHPFGGDELSSWRGVVSLAYSYYIIRAWGGTFRFRKEGKDMITELCLASHV